MGIGCGCWGNCTKFVNVGNNDMYSCRSLQHYAPFKNGSFRISIKSKFGIFNNKSTGEIKAALFDDIEKLEVFIAHNLVEIIQAIVIPVIAIVLMFRINLWMTLVMIIPVIVGVLPTFMMRKYPDLTRKYTNTFSEVMGVTNEYVNCMPIIKMFGLTADKFVKLSKSSKKYTECLKEMAKCSCYPLAFMIVILDSGVLFTLPIGGYLYLNKLISSEEFLVFMLLTMCFYRTFLICSISLWEE